MVAGQATLTGFGSLAGAVIELTQRPDATTYPLQVGYSGDNKNRDEFGASVWFDWVVTSGSSLFDKASGVGDVNILLKPDPDFNIIPLPATGFLLLGALGGLAVFRRRKT